MDGAAKAADLGELAQQSIKGHRCENGSFLQARISEITALSKQVTGKSKTHRFATAKPSHFGNHANYVNSHWRSQLRFSERRGGLVALR